MRTMLQGMALVLTVGAALAAGACGDDGEGTGGGGAGGPVTCNDFASVSGSPSFKDDVMPILTLSCALSTSCHAAPTGMEDLVLGQPMSMGDPDQTLIDTVHAGLVSAASVQSSLPLVDPGNPAGSYLLLKAAYTRDELENTCGVDCTDCGDPMPPPEGTLDADRANIIAAWIASGAPNN